ncbi:MAG: SDR family oxidoreductase [Planctomycetaceae bacterium]
MLEISLKGKNALVTGSSKGIGRGCALAIAKGGGNVAINHRSSLEEAEEAADLVRQAGGKAIIVQADVSEKDAVDEAVRKTVEAFGSLDLFVSNAVYSDRQPFLDADLDGFRKTIDVSMWGAFYGVRAAGRQMREQGHGGSIVVISSPHAEIPFPTAMAYNMAKAAIDHMARTAATELYKYKIRVNVMHPGWIDTPGERKFFDEEQLAAGAASLPWKRLGTIEEIGKAVAFVLSDSADYMTGSTVTMDGGVKLPWWSKREEGGQ